MKKLDNDIILIIVANFTTIFGVIFLGWNLFLVLFLYWIESAIIGFYNIFKISLSKRFGPMIALKIFIIPFFIFHYGIFMLAHLMFIYAITAPNPFQSTVGLPAPNISWQIIIPIGILFLSHGYSFFKNFVGKGEYLKTFPIELMFAPYKRITLMHITLLFGGTISAFITSAMATIGLEYYLRIAVTSTIICIFIILKTIVDINAHNKQHNYFFTPF